jgi:hypothetical protein
MSRLMVRYAVGLALGIAVLGGACTGAETDKPQERVIYTPAGEPLRQHAVPTFDEFAAATRVEGPEIDGELYVVEWDMPIRSRAELWDYYDAWARGEVQKGIVNRVNGVDDVWTSTNKLQLTYCVANEFGANQTRAINEMAAATSAWQSVASVRFVYDPTQNASCNSGNMNIKIPVRPWSSGGACAFFPSGGGCVTRTLVMDFNDFDTDPFWATNAPNLRTVGVFRHELGHVLGLRHEHTRPESGTCFEDSSWRALTPYDQASVMHYPYCNGLLTSDQSVTVLDGLSAISLYSLSSALIRVATSGA